MTGRAVPRGVVLAAGILYQRNAKRRILLAWRPGHRVFVVRGGWVVLLPEPVFVTSETCLGTPLVVDSGRLDGTERRTRAVSATKGRAPPTPENWRWISAGKDVLATAEVLDDPSTWVELGLPVLRLEPLGEPPRPPQSVAVARPIAAIFGVNGAPERQRAMNSLAVAAPLPAWQAGIIGILARMTAPLAKRLPEPPPADVAPRNAAEHVGSALQRLEKWMTAGIRGAGLGWA